MLTTNAGTKLWACVCLMMEFMLFMFNIDIYMFPGQGHGEHYKDDSMDVYQYFNTCCYSGYGDGEEVVNVNF